MFDEMLIKYASPTLGGIKTGNLFKFNLYKDSNIYNLIKNYNDFLNVFNIYLEILYENNNYVLVYIYRLDFLISDFSDEEISVFLRSYGYNPYNIENCICKLKERFKKTCKTPHELGVFLGYPIKDVKGFINNSGKNYKLCGCWKVYDDVEKCAQIFKEYKNCKYKFTHLFHKGYSLKSLIFTK